MKCTCYLLALFHAHCQIDGRNLTDIINETHENVKYLPDLKFTDNVVAHADLRKAVEGATALVFVMPHQFLEKTLDAIEGHVAPGAKAISLIKVSSASDHLTARLSTHG